MKKTLNTLDNELNELKLNIIDIFNGNLKTLDEVQIKVNKILEKICEK
jgi:hypothetical protein